MEYIKKVLMLRRTDVLDSNLRPLSVLARIEVESGIAEFYISVINLPTNLKSDGYYAIVVDSEKREFEFELGCRPTSFSKTFYQTPNVADGVAIGLYSISEQIPITLAFANQGNGVSLAELKKMVADKCYLRLKKTLKDDKKTYKNQTECDLDVQNNTEKEVFVQYNDEAVATENYYEIDSEIKQKIRSIKESDCENLFFENEFANNSNQKTPKEERTFFNGTENEKNACSCKEIKSLESVVLDESFSEDKHCLGDNYYLSVKDELEQIFFSYEREENLEKIFKGSKWAKIYYSKDKFYVVGLVFEQEKEKYICYGVPSKYKKVPPKELEGYSSFIPLSVFDMFGDGFFIMFQDAKTGKCVHFN